MSFFYDIYLSYCYLNVGESNYSFRISVCIYQKAVSAQYFVNSVYPLTCRDAIFTPVSDDAGSY